MLKKLKSISIKRSSSVNNSVENKNKPDNCTEVKNYFENILQI